MRTRIARYSLPVVVLVALGLLVPGAPDAQGVPTVLAETQFCADLGSKQPGEPATQAMANHIADRFAAAGLEVEREGFHLPVHAAESVTAEVLEPTPTSYPAMTLAYGGSGTVEADVVYVGSGRPVDYEGVDAAGKIVMVVRDTTFHRSAQLNEVEAHDGAAMLYVSEAPDNLIQIGTVRFAQHPPPPIMTVTVGADDGAILQQQAEAGTLRMRLSVAAERVDAYGENVIGIKRGTTWPDKIVMVGGHYDSWYAGAVDNCSAIGSMLHIVEAVADEELPYTVMFGAWDAEEVGLTGSYEWVRRHQDLVDDIVVVENLEMVSAATQVGDTEVDAALVNLVFGTVGPAMNTVLAESLARTGHHAAPTTAPVVRESQGGIIPTDLQPFYTQGVQGFSTFSSSAYYHTHEDDTTHIPDGSHERVTEFLLTFLRDVQQVPPEALELREVPEVEVTAPEQVAIGEPVEVTVTGVHADGRPLTGNAPWVLATRDGYWPVVLEQATEDGDGTYRYTVPGELVDRDGPLWFTATFGHSLYAAEGFAATDVTAGPFTRHAGTDRIATAVAIAQATRPQADTIVLATAREFTDALSGAPLAASLDAPVLLTEQDRLSPATAMELTRLRASRVVVLGGEAAVGADVVDALRAMGVTVERIGGVDRYETSAAIASRMGVVDRVAVTSGEVFADALSMAALAAGQDTPLLLTARDSLPESVVALLGPEVDVTIAGGTAAVSGTVADRLEAVAGRVERLAGPDRYATAAAIAEQGLQQGASLDGAWLATGQAFPDGLVAAAAAGAAGVPVLLVDGTAIGIAPTAAVLAAHGPVPHLNVAGGTAAIPNEVLAELAQLR